MQSIWQKDTDLPSREPLKGAIQTDIAVIGAGLTGILTATLLAEKGARVVVLERGTTAGGVTAKTTAKITIQHRLIYDTLIKQMGEDKASLYAKANKQALDRYETMIKEREIDCGFEKMPAYIYSLQDIDKLEKEAAACRSLGIAHLLTDSIELPLKIKGALVYPDQAQFHPLKFIKALADKLTIYENTRVRYIDDRVVHCDNGRVTARAIVMATHYPLQNFPGFYFLRMHQERSYALALENAQTLHGMYIDENTNGLSFRGYGDTLILGGGAHRTGVWNEDKSGYAPLRSQAKQLYPESRETAAWSTQDCVTVDSVPFIGRYSPSTPRLYVATGYKKWGMTNAMVAATLLSDRLLGKRNPFSPVFTPRRFTVAGIPKLAVEGGYAIAGQVSKALHHPFSTLEDLKRGEGGIVQYKGYRVGAYKDNDGQVYLVTTRCPHLGCELKWNPDEKSWDCPCHGSRFDYKGRWLNEPATCSLRLKILREKDFRKS